MYTLLKPISVREELLGRNVSIFTSRDFQRIFQTSDSQTKYYLEKFTLDGFLLRLKRGLYTLKTDPPMEEEMAELPLSIGSHGLSGYYLAEQVEVIFLVHEGYGHKFALSVFDSGTKFNIRFMNILR